MTFVCFPPLSSRRDLVAMELLRRAEVKQQEAQAPGCGYTSTGIMFSDVVSSLRDDRGGRTTPVIPHSMPGRNARSLPTVGKRPLVAMELLQLVRGDKHAS